MGSGYLEPLDAQALEVELNCLLHVLFDFFAGSTSRNAAFQVRRVRGVSCSCFFDDDEVFFHFFIPACFKMLFKVPGASSSFRLPGTVTSPRFVACAYWW